MSYIWRRVPQELVRGEEIYTTQFGDVRRNKQIITGMKTKKDRFGAYSTCSINGNMYYFHDLVFYAWSNIKIADLKRGKVMFKNPYAASINDVYRNWFIDLTFAIPMKAHEDEKKTIYKRRISAFEPII